MFNIGAISVLWFLAVILFCVIEGLTYALICVWFAGGSVVALILSVAGFGLPVQLTAFAVVSAALFLLVRPMARRLTKGKKTSTNADRVIGQAGVVIKRIDPVVGEGQIKVIGQIWSAKPEDGISCIDAEQRVEVIGISGVKAIVRKMN